jgi:hypothetical protein
MRKGKSKLGSGIVALARGTHGSVATMVMLILRIDNIAAPPAGHPMP